MKALCVPGSVLRSDGEAWVDGRHDIAQWTVLTFDDYTAARLAALYSDQPSEGAGRDPDALEAR